MTRIAITGVAGNLGTALVERLARERLIGTIVGIDRRPPAVRHPKLRFHALDVRDEALPGLLRDERVSKIYHLAWVVDPTHHPEQQHDVNVKGTENVLTAALVSGARQLIYASDAMAYGAYSDNPEGLTEEAPLRGNPDFQYACDKAFVEGIVASFARAHPNVAVAVLRPCIVLGAGFDNYLTRLARLPFALADRAGMAPLQFLDVADAVEALWLALDKAARGPFNLAGTGTVPYEDIVRAFKLPFARLPGLVNQAVARALWMARVPNSAPPEILSFVRHPWIVSCQRAERELGFKPARSSREALVAYAAAAGRGADG